MLQGRKLVTQGVGNSFPLVWSPTQHGTFTVLIHCHMLAFCRDEVVWKGECEEKDAESLVGQPTEKQ